MSTFFLESAGLAVLEISLSFLGFIDDAVFPFTFFAYFPI